MKEKFISKLKSSSYIKYAIEVLIIYFLLVIAGNIIANGSLYINFSGSERVIITSLLIVLHSSLYEDKKSFFILLFSMACIFLSIAGIKVITDKVLHIGALYRFINFTVALLNLYILLSCILFKKIYKIIFATLMFIIIYLPIYIFWEYYFISGTLYNAGALLAIMQTNKSETLEYLTVNASTVNYVLLILFMLIAAAVAAYMRKFINRTKNLKTFSTVLLTFLLAVTDLFMIGKYRANILTYPFFNAQHYVQEYQNFEVKKPYRLNSLIKNLESEKSITPPYGGVYVLVIGESQNRKHMSAYGYNRETTPWLDSMKNDDQFLLMKNAYANQVQTVPALSYALTAKNQYNQIELSSAWSLLEVAKAAGFDTVWLSNQAKYGVYDTPTTVIASEAEQQQWINDSTGESVETAYYDEKLLDAMDKIQLSNNMLIIIHLMGSHVDYNQRYPQNFEQYSSGSKIDKYDNSILYNDFVMKNIYERVKIIPNFKGLIYFSDHAEGIDQGLDHNPDYFVPDMTKIPMYMYLSDSYVQEHPQVLALLKTEQDYYFTNDLIYNTMLGIMNIKTGDFYEPQNDLTSGSYDNDYFRFKTLHGEKSIADIDKDN